jgi:hypothetical protein
MDTPNINKREKQDGIQSITYECSSVEKQANERVRLYISVIKSVATCACKTWVLKEYIKESYWLSKGRYLGKFMGHTASIRKSWQSLRRQAAVARSV